LRVREAGPNVVAAVVALMPPHRRAVSETRNSNVRFVHKFAADWRG
jgi:hypothetical protein